MFQENFVNKIKHTHYIPNIFSPVIRALCNNVKEYGTAGQSTDGKIIGRLCIACWIPKATNTLRICNPYCFPLQQRLHERDSMLRYTYTARHVLSEKKRDLTCKNKQVP